VILAHHSAKIKKGIIVRHSSIRDNQSKHQNNFYFPPPHPWHYLAAQATRSHAGVGIVRKARDISSAVIDK
jgi:hypothetical protein